MELTQLTHRDVTEALRTIQSETESVRKAEATRLISALILEDCGHVAPTPVDSDLSIKLTACVVCFAYYSYTLYATKNRRVVGEVVRRQVLSEVRAYDRLDS